MEMTGYKRTEVGVIPVDWEATPLRVIGTPVRGGSPRPAGDPRYFDGSYIPWLTVASLTNIPNHQLLVTETATYLTEEGSRHSRTLEIGTLIIANSGATLGIAKILGVKCCANDGIAAVLNIAKDVCPSYLAHFINMKTDYLREVVATGNGQPNLNTTLIGDVMIPLPPTRNEQEAIARALGDADALIESLERLIEKKRDLKQAAMQRFLTGLRRLPGFTKKWESKPLRDVLKVRHGKTQHGVVSSSGEYPILATSGEIGRTNQYLYDKPSVLIGRKGTIDSPQYVESPFWTIDTLFFTEIFNNADPKFIFYKFSLIDWRSYNEASGVPSLNASTIENIEIVCPCLDEQIAISTVLSDMDVEIAALEARCDKTRAIKEGMTQELLTGKTRLL